MENNLVYSNNAVVEVTKEFEFSSSHFLQEYVGKCSNLHGHNYKLQVTLKGHVNSIGMVVDFSSLKKRVNRLIVEDVDHKNLNDVFFFNSTAENMAVYFFEVIEKSLVTSIDNEDAKVVEIKLWETSTSFVSYKGETVPYTREY